MMFKKSMLIREVTEKKKKKLPDDRKILNLTALIK